MAPITRIGIINTWTERQAICLQCKNPIGRRQTAAGKAYCEDCEYHISHSKHSDIPYSEQAPYLRRTMTVKEFERMMEWKQNNDWKKTSKRYKRRSKNRYKDRDKIYRNTG